jgi:hypothetical protein
MSRRRRRRRKKERRRRRRRRVRKISPQDISFVISPALCPIDLDSLVHAFPALADIDILEHGLVPAAPALADVGEILDLAVPALAVVFFPDRTLCYVLVIVPSQSKMEEGIELREFGIPSSVSLPLHCGESCPPLPRRRDIRRWRGPSWMLRLMLMGL